jgi:hypothetical protein
MLTDDEITTLLRRGLTQATAELDPIPDLARAVRRRYVRSRRRRIAVAVALSAAALAAGSGLALAGGGTSNHTPTHTAVAVPPPPAPATKTAAPNARPTTKPVSSAPVQPAGYRVVLSEHSAPANCPANATAPVSKTPNPRPGVWFWTNGQCFFVGVGGADTKPGGAAPLHLDGFPGLYDTLENGVRTIYAPGIGGRGWWVLDMPATAPLDIAVRIVVPAN